MGAKFAAALLLVALISICVWAAPTAVAQPYQTHTVSGRNSLTPSPPVNRALRPAGQQLGSTATTPSIAATAGDQFATLKPSSVGVNAYATLPQEPLTNASTFLGQEPLEPQASGATAPPENPSAAALSGTEAASAETTAGAGGSAAVAWGENLHGQLGTIYKDASEELPVAVEGLSNIQAVVAAGSFNLALLTNGTVASWGGDRSGQLGDNAFKANWEREKSHAMVSELTEVKAVAASSAHAMALLQDGTVETWGANDLGELGLGTAGFEAETGIDERIPSRVPGLKEDVTALAAGGPSDYALLKHGEIEAWGGNPYGQLGIPWPERCEKRSQPGCEQFECKTEVAMEQCSPQPKLVVDGAGSPIKAATAVSAGQEAAYALLETGEVLSWGSNHVGALGQANVATGQHASFAPPGKVMQAPAQPLTNVVELSAGYDHVLARLKNGEVIGWGANLMGGLGNQSDKSCGNTPCEPLATTISLPSGAKAEAVAAGNRYSLVLAQHKVYAFGRNENGELGNGTTSNSRSPTLVKVPGPVKAISAARTHALAVLEAGTEPPQPAVTAQAKAGAVKIGWAPEKANRLVYRAYESPGSEEYEEESGSEQGGAEEPEGAAKGPPKNITLPRIRYQPILAGQPIEGQTLIGTEGSWSGTEPMKFSYQWQRCKEGRCQPIVGATHPTYEPGEEDVKFFLRLVVTARNSLAPQGVAASSETTPIVKSEEEGRRSPVASINLKLVKQPSVLVDNMFGEPLNPIPYEFKLQTSKIRVFIGRPE